MPISRFFRSKAVGLIRSTPYYVAIHEWGTFQIKSSARENWGWRCDLGAKTKTYLDGAEDWEKIKERYRISPPIGKESLPKKVVG